jgi:hypothetical protein
MDTTYAKKSIVCAWIIALGAIAVALNVSTITGWVALVGVGLPPPLVMLLKWRQPAPTMSEDIRSGWR